MALATTPHSLVGSPDDLGGPSWQVQAGPTCGPGRPWTRPSTHAGASFKRHETFPLLGHCYCEHIPRVTQDTSSSRAARGAPRSDPAAESSARAGWQGRRCVNTRCVSGARAAQTQLEPGSEAAGQGWSEPKGTAGDGDTKPPRRQWQSPRLGLRKPRPSPPRSGPRSVRPGTRAELSEPWKSAGSSCNVSLSWVAFAVIQTGVTVVVLGRCHK